MTARIRITLNGHADRSYDILFGVDLRTAIDDIVARFPDRMKFVVTDSNVDRFHGAHFRRLEQSRGRGFSLIVLPAGERHKTRATKARVEDRLLSMHADRRSVIVAFGGGVVGDLAGFVAATLFRGIHYVNIPTTLLAQVDSSVGGKVAVDHPLGKNLIGAFHQPERVYIDTGVLSTLPAKEFLNGMAEVIKMAAIMDPALFTTLETGRDKILRRDPAVLLPVIRRCCTLKRSVVERDERENDFRRILNFGHTIGHSIETLSGFTIPHGRAVSMGMVAEARLAGRLGLLAESDVNRLTLLLQSYQLPVSGPRNLRPAAIIRQTAMDKKAVNEEVHYTLLEKIGKARVGVRLSQDAVRKAFKG